MEFEIKKMALPPIEWNYDDIKAELEEQMKKFACLVYTDDDIKGAKSDRAFLRKLKDELNERRKEVEREYTAPLETFKAQVKELQDIVSVEIDHVDEAVKDYEMRYRMAKMKDCQLIYERIFKEWLNDIPYARIENPKWYNQSVSLKAVEDEMKERAIIIRNDLEYIDSLEKSKRLSVKYDYLHTLKLSEALALNKERLTWEKAQAPIEAPQTEQKEEKFEISLRVRVNDSELNGLLSYINSNGIELIL